MLSQSDLNCQGAEGIISSILFLSKPAVMKERLSKKYRLKELDDKINKTRLQQELRCMVKCRRSGISTPRYINKF